MLAAKHQPPNRKIDIMKPFQLFLLMFLVQASSFSQTSLLNQLVSYYKLDNTLTDTVGSNNWTNSGGAFTSSGKINSAISFNANGAIGQYCEAPSISLSSAASLSFWFYSYGAQPQHAGVLFKASDVNGDQPIYGAQVELPGNVLYFLSQGSSAGAALTYTFQHNTWYHFVLVFDGPNQRLSMYVNGTMRLDTTNINFTALYNPTTKLKMGMQKSSDRSFQGKLDEIGIWNRVLTDAEVLALYNNGQGRTITSVKQDFSSNPSYYMLNQNYPNPFNPSTTIRFALPQRSHVTLTVYNILGQDVADLVNADQQAGWNQVVWNANVSSGVYFCRLEAISVSDPRERFMDVKKMLLLR
jgi:hypothetical protein